MKDLSREKSEHTNFMDDALESLEAVLEQLYEDESASTTDSVTKDLDLTFEELIGTLVAARNEIRTLRAEQEGSSGSSRGSSRKRS